MIILRQEDHRANNFSLIYLTCNGPLFRLQKASLEIMRDSPSRNYNGVVKRQLIGLQHQL